MPARTLSQEEEEEEEEVACTQQFAPLLRHVCSENALLALSGKYNRADSVIML